MPYRKILPSQQYLKECFDYDPFTGNLTWRSRPLHHFKNIRGQRVFNSQRAEIVVTHKTNYGYGSVRVDGVHTLTHRIVWKIMTGKEPPEYIDHKDLNKGNNTWSNLRESSNSQNLVNKLPISSNTSGHPGVHWNKQCSKWHVELRLGGRRYYLGLFPDLPSAIKVRDAKAAELHGDFYREV